MKHLALLLLLYLATVPHLAWSVEKDCAAPLKGRYTNSDHGYMFLVPKGLSGKWQSPCAYDESTHDCVCIGSHGLYMPISDTAALNVFSSYPVEPVAGGGAQIVAGMVSDQRESTKILGATQIDVGRVVVAGNVGRKLTVKWLDPGTHIPMEKYSYLFATRPGETKWPRAELTVSLIAPESEISALVPTLDTLLRSIKWLGDSDIP